MGARTTGKMESFFKVRWAVSANIDTMFRVILKSTVELIEALEYGCLGVGCSRRSVIINGQGIKIFVAICG